MNQKKASKYEAFVGVPLPKKTKDLLDRFCKRTGAKKYKVVGDAILNYLETANAKC